MAANDEHVMVRRQVALAQGLVNNNVLPQNQNDMPNPNERFALDFGPAFMTEGYTLATNESKKNVVTSTHEQNSLMTNENPANQSDRTSRLYPDLDADGEYVHFEMTPSDGDSLLWLTLRRGITPERAAMSLRKIADLIDRQGLSLLKVLEGRDEPVRLSYNDAGDIVVAAEQ